MQNNSTQVNSITRLGVTQIPGGSATVSEALKLAGADWTVEKQPIYNGFMEPVEGFSRIVKSSDPSSTLHVCKSSYEPINNSLVFGVLDQVLGTSHAQVERVGCIKGGKVVFMQAKMPNSIEVLKGDGMDMYINAITSHDGSQLARVFFSATRLVCQNQLRASIKNRAERAISIRHTKNAEMKFATAGDVLMDGVKEWDVIKENAKILANKSVSRLQTKEFVEKLFPTPTDSTSRDSNKTKRECVYELIESGMGTEIAGVKGSAWGLYNAATEYFDHHATIKGDASRYSRSLVNGDKFRDQVFEAAMTV